MGLRLGVIADDFTGATDISSFFVEAGIRTVQLNEPDEAVDFSPSEDIEALVVGLKTRSVYPKDAVSRSLSALKLLRKYGAERIIFKYCSTFDSSSQGNIGPVTDALMKELDQELTVVVPALPVNGRTVYQGHLFVYGQLLEHSGMRDHPVTPMTDSRIPYLMEQQSNGGARTVAYEVVSQGEVAIREALAEVQAEGARYAVIDALQEADLLEIGKAVRDFPLTTGGSGLGYGVARAIADSRDSTSTGLRMNRAMWTYTSGGTVVLAGSASRMTQQQVVSYREIAAARRIEVSRVIESPENYLSELTRWVLMEQESKWAPLLYTAADLEDVQQVQEEYGAAEASQMLEEFTGKLARSLHREGISQFIVAGGETSGAVTQALRVRAFEVGPQIAPGVPWVQSINGDIDLALKSGNFGQIDFFRRAQQVSIKK